MKIFSAQLKGTTTVATGANVSLTGSFSGSIAGIDINATNTFTASTIARLNSIETISSSNDGRVNSLELFSSSIYTTNTFTSSASARLNSIETITASNVARLNSLENKTGSLATTGSNTFIGNQIFSGTLYVQNNLVVQGSSSLQNITASAVSIGTNTVLLNTDNPSVRFGGVSVIDSGSASGKSGSLYFDSTDNEWVFVHSGNTAVTSSIMITGPETYDSLGNETRLTTNRIPKSTNNFHIIDSCITDNGGCVGINTSNPQGNLDVAASDPIIRLTPSSGTYAFLQKLNTANGNYLRIYDGTQYSMTSCGGNIGIGTSAAGTSLMVSKFGPDANWGTANLFDSQTHTTGVGGVLTFGGFKCSQTTACSIFGKIVGAKENSTGGDECGYVSIQTNNNVGYNERLRITSGGCVTLCSNNLPLASISQFGYASNYQVLILGNTNNAQAKSLAFGVDVSANNSGAFSGYGNEYIWRCVGSFITPNPANNGYNTIFNWNGGGCTWFSNALGVGITSPTSTLHVKSVNDGFRLESACARGTGQIYFSFGDPTGRKGYLGYGSSTSDLLVLSNDMNAPVAIYTNDTKRVSIAGSGEVTFCCQICTPGISITSNPIGVEYLIVAGGGGGGWDVGGGGGAGGVLNGSTGIWPGTYIVAIGGGGNGATTGAPVSPNNGYNTYAIGLTAIGGGGGGNYSNQGGLSGGSGGGGAGYGATTNAGFGMKGQGFEGGCGINVGGNQSTGGGGGGAGGAGPSSVSNIGGSTVGGAGILSTIIGQTRSYGCGGRGGGDSWSGPMYSGTANTGYGGDGAGIPNEGCAGGSGIVIIKMKNSNSASFSGGLTTYTCTNVTGYNIYVVTAGAGTMTIL